MLPSHRSRAEQYHIAIHGHSQPEFTTAGIAQDERAVVDLSYIRNEVLQKVELLCYVTQMTTMLTVLSSTTGVTSHNSA